MRIRLSFLLRGMLLTPRLNSKFEIKSDKVLKSRDGSVPHLLLGDHAKVESHVIGQEIVNGRPFSKAMVAWGASLEHFRLVRRWCAWSPFLLIHANLKGISLPTEVYAAPNAFRDWESIICDPVRLAAQRRVKAHLARPKLGLVLPISHVVPGETIWSHDAAAADEPLVQQCLDFFG